MSLNAPALLRRARSDEKINIGYVGRLSPEKNVRMLAALEAALVAAGRGDVRFTIVGNGSEREWLERTARPVERTLVSAPGKPPLA